MISSSLCSNARLFDASGKTLPSPVETLVAGTLVGGGGGGALLCGDDGITGLEPGIGGTLPDLLAIDEETKGTVGDFSFDSR